MCQRKRAQSLRIGHSQGNLSFYEINRLMRLQEGKGNWKISFSFLSYLSFPSASHAPWGTAFDMQLIA